MSENEKGVDLLCANARNLISYLNDAGVRLEVSEYANCDHNDRERREQKQTAFATAQ